MSSRITRSTAQKSKVPGTVEVGTSNPAKKDAIMRTSTTSTDAKISKTKSKKQPKSQSKQKKDLLEYHLSQVIVPADLKLPPDFIEYHHPDFIKALEHIISIDKTLYPVIVLKKFTLYKHDYIPLDNLQDYFHSLCSGVIAQQVSGAAAKSIESKVCRLFNENYEEGSKYFPSPREIVSKSDEELRSAGLSMRKAEYVKVISENILNGVIDEELFKSNKIEEITKKLVALKGIGEWSAKMFLMFALRKEDIFAHDDLGVARGCSRYFSARPELFAKIKKEVIIEHNKKSKFETGNSKRDWIVYKDEYVNHVADMFKPYRSALMLVFWRLGSTNIELLEDTGNK